MATTRNQDGTFSYSGPILADPEAQAALEQSERDALLANEATLRERAAQALAVNDAYVALANPTQAQAIAQVKIVTRECSAIIRLLQNRLETVAGT